MEKIAQFTYHLDFEKFAYEILIGQGHSPEEADMAVGYMVNYPSDNKADDSDEGISSCIVTYWSFEETDRLIAELTEKLKNKKDTQDRP